MQALGLCVDEAYLFHGRKLGNSSVTLSENKTKHICGARSCAGSAFFGASMKKRFHETRHRSLRQIHWRLLFLAFLVSSGPPHCGFSLATLIFIPFSEQMRAFFALKGLVETQSDFVFGAHFFRIPQEFEECSYFRVVEMNKVFGVIFSEFEAGRFDCVQVSNCSWLHWCISIVLFQTAAEFG